MSGSLGSLGCFLGVVALICDRWVHSGAPWRFWGSFRVVGFTRLRMGVVGFIQGHLVHSDAP